MQGKHPLIVCEPTRRLRRWLGLLALICGAVAWCGSVPSGAAAAGTHPYTGQSFGPGGVGSADTFGEVAAVAVDQSTGDVYVYGSEPNAGTGGVFKFDENGEPVNFAATGSNVVEGLPIPSGSAEFELAVAPPGAPGGTAGDIYVAVNDFGAELKVYRDTGEPLQSLAAGEGELCGVATDPSGNLYVGIFPNTVQKYVPSANPPKSTDRAPETGVAEVALCNVAADGNGNAFAAGFAGELFKLPGLVSGPERLDPTASTVAIDASDNHVFANRGSEFVEYDASGEAVSTSGNGLMENSRGIAADAGGKKVYASVAGATRVGIFGPLELVIEAATQPPSELGGTEGTLHGTVNPGGHPVTECSFEFGPTEAYGESAPCLGEIPTDESAHPVAASLTGLQPAQLYHYRLVAKSGGIEGGSPDGTFRTAGATIEGEGSSDNSFSEATLHALINPHGFPTSYHFQYLTEEQFRNDGGFGSPHVISTNEATVGEDNVNHEVTIRLSGLTAGTAYRFRAVALSQAADDAEIFGPGSALATRGGEGTAGPECVNETLRAENSSLDLPDCRSYERVSPGFKNGGSFGQTFSAEGPRVGVESFGNFAGTESAGLLRAPYEFTRSESGWSTVPMSAPNALFPSTNTANPLHWFGDDGIALYGLRRADQPLDAEFLYRGRGSALESFGPEAPPTSWVGNSDLTTGTTSSSRFLGPVVTNPDVSHVVYTLVSPGARNYLWPFDGTGEGSRPSVYEYAATGANEPFLVGVNGAQGSTSLISGCGTSIGAPPLPDELVQGTYQAQTATDTYNAVSTSGDTVFFTALPGSCGSAIPSPAQAELYARIDGERSTAHTVSISEPNSTDCTQCDTALAARKSATFQGASEDGSKVYFLTDQELLPGNPGMNLYLYDSTAPPEHRVRSVSHVASGGPAGVAGVVRLSEDGNRVYFVATGILPAGTNSTGASAVAGADNMYVYTASTGSTQFVATLASSEADLWGRFDQREAEATPDGRYLLFASTATLTPDDTSTASQLFRYDAVTGELARVSVGRQGFNNNGNTTQDPAIIPLRFTNYTGHEEAPASKMISDDGAYVFFESTLGLTPKALDHVVINRRGGLASNIYEYHDGLVSLLSDGQDRSSLKSSTLRSAVEFIGTDAAGTDALFTTADPLIPADLDSAQDVYDARVDGGFPAQTTSRCSGDTCQGALQTASASAPASSSLLIGPENPKPHSKKRKHKHPHRKRKKPAHHKHPALSHRQAARGKK